MFNFLRNWFNKKSDVLDAVKVEIESPDLLNIALKWRSVQWHEKMVPYFSCPLYVLQKFSAYIETSHGTFVVKNPSVARDRDTGVIDVVWPLIAVLRDTEVYGIYICDEYGKCIAKNTYHRNTVDSNCDIRPSYRLTV